MPVNNKPNIASSLHSGASSATNNNSKIAAGPLSGNEASHKNGISNAPMSQYNHNGEDEHELGDEMGPSDTDDDDDEERLDCVHDIHGDGEEADDEDVENGADNMNSDEDSGKHH